MSDLQSPVGHPASPETDGHPLLLEARHVTQEYSLRGRAGGKVHAVSDVSLTVRDHETLGVVGETGCGKSTLARAILQEPKPTAGQVLLRGEDLVRLPAKRLREARRNIQMVAQDPFGSLDPRWRVSRLVEEPLAAHKVGSPTERRARVADLLEMVGLDATRYSHRYPHQLSGGQCQRVAIARALALSPEVVVCDEAVSSLDVSIQAQILNLFESLKSLLGLSYLFISHDLTVVKHVSDRVAVMYLGKLCEVGTVEGVYAEPRHPYTAALLKSIPEPDPKAAATKRAVLSGEPPSPVNPPSGCRFRTRCPRAQARCAEEEPLLQAMAPGHEVACHFPLTPGGNELPGFP